MPTKKVRVVEVVFFSKIKSRIKNYLKKQKKKLLKTSKEKFHTQIKLVKKFCRKDGKGNRFPRQFFKLKNGSI